MPFLPHAWCSASPKLSIPTFKVGGHACDSWCQPETGALTPMSCPCFCVFARLPVLLPHPYQGRPDAAQASALVGLLGRDCQRPALSPAVFLPPGYLKCHLPLLELAGSHGPTLMTCASSKGRVRLSSGCPIPQQGLLGSAHACLLR